MNCEGNKIKTVKIKQKNNMKNELNGLKYLENYFLVQIKDEQKRKAQH